jgi:predicted small metal-binding protein
MKTLTCRDLGGSCDLAFTGESFEEIGEKCHEHVMEQIHKADEAHISAANKMRDATADKQKVLIAEFKRKFDEAPDV